MHDWLYCYVMQWNHVDCLASHHKSELNWIGNSRQEAIIVLHHPSLVASFLRTRDMFNVIGVSEKGVSRHWDQTEALYLGSKFSATELWVVDNHQLLQFSLYVLPGGIFSTSVTHLAITHWMTSSSQQDQPGQQPHLLTQQHTKRFLHNKSRCCSFSNKWWALPPMWCSSRTLCSSRTPCSFSRCSNTCGYNNSTNSSMSNKQVLLNYPVIRSK